MKTSLNLELQSAIALSVLLVSAIAHADPMYISDKLVVNVYAEADQESSKVATLDSGDAVEAIEKVDSYTHVRLADEREGWIKSSYLSSQAPAIVRLKELEKELGAGTPTASTQLADELRQLKEQNAALQTELATAKQAAVPAPVAPMAATQPQARVESETSLRNDAVVSPPIDIGPTHVGWGAGLVALGGVIGFALGYQALARRIRRKYGSVRIY